MDEEIAERTSCTGISSASSYCSTSVAKLSPIRCSVEMGKNPHLLGSVRFCSGSMSTRVRFGSGSCQFFSQPSIYIDGWLYAMSMTSVVCNVPVLSQNDWTYHHSVFTT